MRSSKVIKSIQLISESVVLLLCSLFIKRKENYIAIGSWSGSRYADNSRYLAEYISTKRKDLKLFWVGNPSIKHEVEEKIPGVVFLNKESFKSNLQLLKCKYMFFSQMHDADISKANVYHNAIMCYLHHGMPIKKWGEDGLSQTVKSPNIISQFVHHITGQNIQYDYFVTSSPLHVKTNCTGLAYKGCLERKNIHTGTPRNDMYFNVNDWNTTAIKKRYAESLGFDPKKRIIMYLPTYRRTTTDVFSFSTLSESEKKDVFNLLSKHDCVLIEKSHMAEKNEFGGDNDDQIICAPSEMNVQEMMLFADCLISDYSGAYLDYILLDRPIIHFAYDYEYYRTVDSGLYYEIEDFSAGPVAYDFKSLLKDMDESLSGIDSFQTKRHYVREKYMSYEKGNAAEQIVNAVIGGIK